MKVLTLAALVFFLNDTSVFFAIWSHGQPKPSNEFYKLPLPSLMNHLVFRFLLFSPRTIIWHHSGQQIITKAVIWENGRIMHIIIPQRIFQVGGVTTTKGPGVDSWGRLVLCQWQHGRNPEVCSFLGEPGFFRDSVETSYRFANVDRRQGCLHQLPVSATQELFNFSSYFPHSFPGTPCWTLSWHLLLRKSKLTGELYNVCAIMRKIFVIY